MTNEMFRDHVTSAGFVLTLGRTHLAALIRLDLELAANVRTTMAGPKGSIIKGDPSMERLHRHDVTGYAGLISRGLIRHVYEENKHRYRDKRASERQGRDVIDHQRMPVGEQWEITRAGRLVVDLLRECGLYADYAGPLGPLIERERQRAEAAS